MSDADQTRPVSLGDSSSAWTLYGWGVRLLRWSVAFPAAALLVAAIATISGGSTTTTTAALLALFSIVLLGAGFSTAIYHRSGPLGRTVEVGTIRADMMTRLSMVFRIARQSGMVAAAFVANFVVWFVPLTIADQVIGDRGTSGQEIAAYLIWCGCCAWLTVRFGKPVMRRLAGRPAIPSPVAESTGAGQQPRTSAAWAAPADPIIAFDGPMATPQSMDPQVPPPLTSTAIEPLNLPLNFGSSVSVVTDKTEEHVSSDADVHPQSFPSVNPSSIKPQILDELDNTQRRAIWLLQQHQSVTVGELAGALDLRTARVAGFMHGLNRQLAALGCRCFLIETLPSGEQQYIFTLQETHS